MSKSNLGSTHEVLARVQSLLHEGQPNKAIELLSRCRMGNPELSNAYEFCLLRAGELDKAVDVYQGLCLNGSVCFKPGSSTLHLVNYATALLLKGNVSGCLAALHRAPDPSHPAAQRLLDAIQRWQRSLGWVQRLRMALASYRPAKPVELGFEPGQFANGTGS